MATKPNPPDDPIVLPEDAARLVDLDRAYCDSRQALPAIHEILLKAGDVIISPDGYTKLCSKARYLAALSQFCTRAGIHESSLLQGRTHESFVAKIKAVNDAAVRQQMQQLGHVAYRDEKP